MENKRKRYSKETNIKKINRGLVTEAWKRGEEKKIGDILNGKKQGVKRLSM